jgi:hypothetical protein
MGQLAPPTVTVGDTPKLVPVSVMAMLPPVVHVRHTRGRSAWRLRAATPVGPVSGVTDEMAGAVYVNVCGLRGGGKRCVSRGLLTCAEVRACERAYAAALVRPETETVTARLAPWPAGSEHFAQQRSYSGGRTGGRAAARSHLNRRVRPPGAGGVALIRP